MKLSKSLFAVVVFTKVGWLDKKKKSNFFIFNSE